MPDKTSSAPRRRLIAKPAPAEPPKGSHPEGESCADLIKLARKGRTAPNPADIPSAPLDGLPAAEDLLRVWLGQWKRAGYRANGVELSAGTERLHRQAEIVNLPHPLQKHSRFKKPVTTDPQFQGADRNAYLREQRKRTELMSFEWIQTLVAGLVAEVERHRRTAFTTWHKLYDAEGGKGLIQAFLAWQSEQELFAKAGLAAVNAAGLGKAAPVPLYGNIVEDLKTISANLSLASFFDERLRQHSALGDCEPGFMLPDVMRVRLEATLGQIRADLDEICTGLGALSDVREWAPLLDWKPEGVPDAEKLELDFQRVAFETWEAVLPDEVRRYERQRIKTWLNRRKPGPPPEDSRPPWVRIEDTWAVGCNGYAIDFKVRSLRRALAKAEARANSTPPTGTREQRLATAKATFKAQDDAEVIANQLAKLQDSGGRYYA